MSTSPEEIERLIAKHGELYRQLIPEWIAWLDENEPSWPVDPDDPIDRDGSAVELFLPG